MLVISQLFDIVYMKILIYVTENYRNGDLVKEIKKRSLSKVGKKKKIIG